MRSLFILSKSLFHITSWLMILFKAATVFLSDLERVFLFATLILTAFVFPFRSALQYMVICSLIGPSVPLKDSFSLFASKQNKLSRPSTKSFLARIVGH